MSYIFVADLNGNIARAGKRQPFHLENTMKILLFMFYANLYNSKRLTPERNPETQALFELIIVLITLLIGIMLSVINRIGLWPWLLANWPYEYGHIHSKNLLAPTGILSIIVCTTVYLVLKKYLAKRTVRNEIELRFNNKLGHTKAAKFAPATVILMPFNIVTSVFFALGYWLLFSSCILVWVALELWVRKTFYWNTPQK